MRGHAPILQMRLNRQRPGIVFLGDMHDPATNDWHNPGEKYREQWTPDHATVYVEPTDRIGRLDLRFLAGCRVSITCTTQDRAMALFDACKRAGATTVAATHIIFTNSHVCKSGWTEIYKHV